VIKDLPGNSLHRVSRWPIFVFLISAILCLGFSATFHLFYSVGVKFNKVFLRLDYAGISLLISGSTFPPFVYGFYCQPKYYILYLSLIGSACLLVFFVSLSDKIHSFEYRKVKSIMYGSLGIFAGGPIFHLVIME
jgi:adiponectin receptor